GTKAGAVSGAGCGALAGGGVGGAVVVAGGGVGWGSRRPTVSFTIGSNPFAWPACWTGGAAATPGSAAAAVVALLARRRATTAPPSATSTGQGREADRTRSWSLRILTPITCHALGQQPNHIGR